MERLVADKRGISPLLATLLLIALSIGMGVAVMSWGEDYIEEKAEFVQGVQETLTSCDHASFSIILVSGVQQLCQEKNTIKGLIDNGPDADIADFHVRVAGETGVFVQESTLRQPLPRGSATPIAFSIGDIGTIKQIKFTPKIVVSGTPVLCSKQASMIENIRQC